MENDLQQAAPDQRSGCTFRRGLASADTGSARLVGEPRRPHPHQITAWKAQLQEGAAGVFGSGPAAADAVPVVDLKVLHAKIGELTLEKDFLSGALSKAGLLSAKR